MNRPVEWGRWSAGVVPALLLSCGFPETDQSDAQMVDVSQTVSVSSVSLEYGTSDVDLAWNPWDGETFERAAAADRPLLLYFAAEGADGVFSDADASVRHLVENKFLAVRVNPFYRPDLAYRYAPDGWPALCLLMPSGIPVAVATDLPAHNVRTWLMRMAIHYEKRRDVLGDSAAAAVSGTVVQRSFSPDDVFAAIKARRDPFYEGLGDGTKFPDWLVLHFLLEYYRTTGNPAAREIWLASVDALLHSPIWDKEAGGIHTFSHTPDWTTPSGVRDVADQASLLEMLLFAYQDQPRRFAPLLDRQLAFVRDVFYDDQRRWFHGRQVRVMVDSGDAKWWTDATGYADRNARMILALLKASQVLDEPQWASLALGVCDTLLATFVTASGRVRHCDDTNRCVSGLLTDQLLVSQALWRAHEWRVGSRFLYAAQQTLNWAEKHLYSPQNGAFIYGPMVPGLSWRQLIPFRDGIHAAGNALAVEVYLERKRSEAARRLVTGIRVAGDVSPGHAGIAAAMMRLWQVERDI